jgi:4-alpha-glucanotransferase
MTRSLFIMADLTQQLHNLASLHGIHLTYWDVTGKLIQATNDGLLRVLHALGSPVTTLEDVPAAVSRRQHELAARGLQPAAVCWDGYPPELTLRMLEADAQKPHRCTLVLENGTRYAWDTTPANLPDQGGQVIEGKRYTARRLHLIGPYPLGYHKLTLEGAGKKWACTLISAPMQVAEPQGGRHSRTWGLFAPLYALHSKRSWGAGDFADLDELVSWVQRQGGGMVATLPMLAAFLDEPFEPSPYSPVSRLFWNEFYINVEQVPEVRCSAKAKELLASTELRQGIEELRQAPMVDYAKQMALKRRVLEECARTLNAEGGPRRAAWEKWLEGNAEVRDYSIFRAVCDRRRAAWGTWPERLRDGKVSPDDFDPATAAYHFYVQWIADEQLQALAEKARGHGPGLYLDLPLGVNASGYDVWRWRNAFALECAAGAPPDPFFASGQNWGFPPMHPERIREGGYPYLRAYLRHHLRKAGVLRIDHMMGLHRLYFIPHGMGAKDGVYVSYQAEEQYAVFVLEAHRHASVLVGEDLGTVPDEVPQMMARHKVHRMYILQYQIQPKNEGLAPIFPGAVASFGTHDMPTFAAYWQGLDIDDRQALGQYDAASAAAEKSRRRELTRAVETFLRQRGLLGPTADLSAILKACQIYLSESPARVALANVEDFWLETNPQNVPGTWRERPNWLRRVRKGLEEFTQMPEVLEILRAMDRGERR